MPAVNCQRIRDGLQPDSTSDLTSRSDAGGDDHSAYGAGEPSGLNRKRRLSNGELNFVSGRKPEEFVSSKREGRKGTRQHRTRCLASRRFLTFGWLFFLPVIGFQSPYPPQHHLHPLRKPNRLPQQLPRLPTRLLLPSFPNDHRQLPAGRKQA